MKSPGSHSCDYTRCLHSFDAISSGADGVGLSPMVRSPSDGAQNNLVSRFSSPIKKLWTLINNNDGIIRELAGPSNRYSILGGAGRTQQVEKRELSSGTSPVRSIA